MSRVEDGRALEQAAAALLDALVAAGVHADPRWHGPAVAVARLTGDDDGPVWWAEHGDPARSPYPRGPAPNGLVAIARRVRALARSDDGVGFGPPAAQLHVHVPHPLRAWVRATARARRCPQRDVVEEAVLDLPDDPGSLVELVDAVDDAWRRDPSALVPQRVCWRVGEPIDEQLRSRQQQIASHGRRVTRTQLVVAAIARAHLGALDARD